MLQLADGCSRASKVAAHRDRYADAKGDGPRGGNQEDRDEAGQVHRGGELHRPPRDQAAPGAQARAHHRGQLPPMGIRGLFQDCVTRPATRQRHLSANVAPENRAFRDCVNWPHPKLNMRLGCTLSLTVDTLTTHGCALRKQSHCAFSELQMPRGRDAVRLPQTFVRSDFLALGKDGYVGVASPSRGA